MTTKTVTPAQDPSQMSLWDHLTELRNRVFWAFGAICIGTVVGFFVAGDVLNIIREPYCRVVELPANCELVVLDPTGSVFEYLRIALLVGGVLAIPVLTYQLLMFILPGLTSREKRYILLSLPAITLLFAVGVGFAWGIFLPPALGFLEGFGSATFRAEWSAELYISFVTSLLFWFGVAFEMPLVFFVISLLGLVTPQPMIKNWRFAIVGSAIASAFITPTIDPMNMALVIVPLLGLYVLSIILVWIGSKMAIIPPADPVS
jgi:sec-independent protein translocase protein TatC